MESHKISRTVLVLTCLALFKIVNCFEIELYSEKDRRGQSIKVDVSDNDCSELPEAWHSGVASVDTLGNCVQFYDEPKCKGSLTVIQPFHIIHQMDLSLINYAFRIRTTSPCGPKLKSGRYVIQNAADASIMAALNKHGNFAKVFTVNATKVVAVPKAQQWEIVEKTNNEYSLKPRENSDNYPVSFDEDSLKKGVIKRKSWRIMSVGRGRYIIKDIVTQRCLYKTDDHKVEEHSCRIWSTNQEWVFRTIVGDTPSEKPKAQVGQGINFNILSKVATSRPPTRPPPQYNPIYYNATQLAQIKKYSTAEPYRIKKKIKRGPRPKTKYVDEPSLSLKPPGLRPAIPANIANNNNFLTFKPPNGPAKDSYLPEDFVPSDDLDLIPTKDMIKSTKQYKEYMDIVKQYLAEQHLKNMKAEEKKKKKKAEKVKTKGSEDEEEQLEEKDEDEEEEDEVTSVEEEEVNSDESAGESKATKKPAKGKKKKKKDKPEDDEDVQDDKPLPPPSAPLTEDHPGFMSQVFSKFKSNFAFMVPTVQLPSIPKIPKVLPSMPSLPSIPVPKLSLTFSKPTEKGKKKKKRKFSDKHYFHASDVNSGSTSGNSGFTFSFSAGLGGNKNGNKEKRYTEESSKQYSQENQQEQTRLGGLTRFFMRSSSTSTKTPLTVGSWGIFG